MDMVISTLPLCGLIKKTLSLMGFGDKKLAAPGLSLLSLSKSSMAQPITELGVPVTLETGEHRPQRRHGKQGGGCLLVPLTLLLSFSSAHACTHTDTHSHTYTTGVGGKRESVVKLYYFIH